MLAEGRWEGVFVPSRGSVQFGLENRMVFNYPRDSSRSPIPLYRAYSGESESKKTRDVIKAFVDQTNQSSLRKILISQKRSENMKMGKSFTYKIKKAELRVSRSQASWQRQSGEDCEGCEQLRCEWVFGRWQRA